MKELKDIKFNISKEMFEYLVKFEELKEELNKLYNLDKNDDTLLKIMEKEQQLNNYRQKFIDKFRNINKSEIQEYVNLKDNE